MDTRPYTHAELRDFARELEPHRVHKTVSGTQVSFIVFDAFLVAQKACVRRYGDYAPAIADVVLYRELNDKYAQLQRLNARTRYAKEKELEAHDAAV